MTYKPNTSTHRNKIADAVQFALIAVAVVFVAGLLTATHINLSGLVKWLGAICLIFVVCLAVIQQLFVRAQRQDGRHSNKANSGGKVLSQRLEELHALFTSRNVHLAQVQDWERVDARARQAVIALNNMIWLDAKGRLVGIASLPDLNDLDLVADPKFVDLLNVEQRRMLEVVERASKVLHSPDEVEHLRDIERVVDEMGSTERIIMELRGSYTPGMVIEIHAAVPVETVNRVAKMVEQATQSLNQVERALAGRT